MVRNIFTDELGPTGLAKLELERLKKQQSDVAAVGGASAPAAAAPPPATSLDTANSSTASISGSP
eukprot:55728-Lingulodinium_polyedra.AAC.1